MGKIKYSLENNARILKSHVSKYAVIGLVISLLSIVVATLAVGYQMTGGFSLQAVILAQSSNIALMILDTTPIVFMFWGQSISTVMSYSAGAMVIDQTSELRMEARGLQSKFLHESSHDHLTDLANRTLFSEHVENTIKKNMLKEGRLAILMINLQNFRELNTGFGSYNADRLLVQFALRLQSVISDLMLLARFGGDEFAILMPDLKNDQQAFKFFEKVKKVMEMPFALDGIEIDLRTISGVTFYPEHGKDAETLIHRAHIAVYHALHSVKELSVYNSAMDNASQNRLILLSELRKAIDEKQLQIYFQPIVDLANGKITNCEALLYWEHATFGMMCAEKFIPIAEKTSLIKSIT